MFCFFCGTEVDLTDEGYSCAQCNVFVNRNLIAELLAYEVAEEMGMDLDEEES